MAAKKEDKIQIRNFKDSSSNWFVNFAHYYLNENNELLWASGESDSIEYRTAIEAYIKRNKKTFKAREVSILDKEERVYTTLNFGRYSGKNLTEIKDLDRKYLLWLKKETKDDKLREEIISILK
nr:MAG TPA: Putative quorum-sensing-regulated virulence factor [Caudoviricetes sp.]